MNYKRDIEQYINSCLNCSTRNGFIQKSGTLLPIPVGEPWEQLTIDIVGPLTETERGNRYIIVISDYLTKLPEAFPCGNISTETIATILVNKVILRCGFPKKITFWSRI